MVKSVNYLKKALNLSEDDFDIKYVAEASF